MNDRLKLTESLRRELKKPLGAIFKDARGIPKGKTIICVGDVACDDALAAGLNPLVCVYDNKSRRCDIKPLESIGNYRAELVEIENNAGELANAAFREIGKARESKTRTKIFVRGEDRKSVV